MLRPFTDKIIPCFIKDYKISIIKIFGKFNLDDVDTNFSVTEDIDLRSKIISEKLKNTYFRSRLRYDKENKYKLKNFKFLDFILSLLYFDKLVKIPDNNEIDHYINHDYQLEKKLAISFSIGILMINEHKIIQSLFRILIISINVIIKYPIKSILTYLIISFIVEQAYFILVPKKYLIRDIIIENSFKIEIDPTLENLILKIKKDNTLLYGGARCCDGTISLSKGRGTCSWHNGVCYWVSSGSCALSIHECELKAKKIIYDSEKELVRRSWYYKLIDDKN